MPETLVSLRDFLERVIAEMDRRYEDRFQAQQRESASALVAAKEALSIALTAAEKSAAAAMEANRVLAAKAEEFADQKVATHNAIRPWVQSLHEGTAERIAVLERRVSRFENREEGVSLTTKLLVSALGVLATLVGIYFAFR